MRHHVPVRALLAALVAAALIVAGATVDAEAQKKGGTIRVGNLGEPPTLDAHWTTASITERAPIRVRKNRSRSRRTRRR